MSALQKRFAHLFSVLSVLLVLALLAAGYAWWQLRGSRPQLDGACALGGLSAPVKVERDALGVPTITGTTRADVARATGFVHAQDRFFQMDLLRRTGAGELAEIFGPEAVPVDRAHRLHGFRRLAEKILTTLPADQRALLEAYTAGVNAGVNALPKTPWEYLVLRVPPQAWRAEDSLLVGFAMWFTLQDVSGRQELDFRAVRDQLGQRGLDFFAPPGDSWDAALDGSTFAPAPFPPVRFKPTEGAAVVTGSESNLSPGSNSFAVDGAHTATGSALLAGDMHLALGVPTTWYRAVLAWTDTAGAPHRIVGVTLPGTPPLISGSNGRIAWAFTNAYVDTCDVVFAEMEPTAGIHYRTQRGWTEIEQRSETILVKGDKPVTFTAGWTEWGPIIGRPAENRALVLRWNAHDPASTNLNLVELETAATTAEAVAIAHRTGMPNQNFLVADDHGAIAWTLTGTIPRRVGFDGREPASWAFGDRYWDGWLPADDVPVVTAPAAGFLWTANQRMLGGEAFAKLGDGGYEGGARARQIRDGLQALVGSGKKARPADLLAIQLDDRAVFLARWQQLLLGVLSDDAVGQKPELEKMRDAVRAWNGRASVDSAAYRIVRAFREQVAARAFAPFFATAAAYDENFSFAKFHYEDALWRLVQEQPVRLLDPASRSWDNLMLQAAEDVRLAAEQEAGSPAKFTWGARNTLHMRHPFSSFLPAPLARLLDMPREPLPGDNDMPRVQGPAFGASERLVVSPGHEAEGLFHMPGGQSGHPLSPYYRAGHEAWGRGAPTPLLPGPTQHTLTLRP